MTKFTLLAAAAFGLATLTSTPVAAQSSVDVQTQPFDLSNAKGQRALDARLRVAVREVCGVAPTVRDLREVRNHRQCVASARASFNDQRSVAIARAQSKAEAARMAVANRNGAEG